MLLRLSLRICQFIWFWKNKSNLIANLSVVIIVSAALKVTIEPARYMYPLLGGKSTEFVIEWWKICEAHTSAMQPLKPCQLLICDFDEFAISIWFWLDLNVIACEKVKVTHGKATIEFSNFDGKCSVCSYSSALCARNVFRARRRFLNHKQMLIFLCYLPTWLTHRVFCIVYTFKWKSRRDKRARKKITRNLLKLKWPPSWMEKENKTNVSISIIDRMPTSGINTKI